MLVFSLRRKLHGDLCSYTQKNLPDKGMVGWYEVADKGITRSSGKKLESDEFNLDTRCNFLLLKLMECRSA